MHAGRLLVSCTTFAYHYAVVNLHPITAAETVPLEASRGRRDSALRRAGEEAADDVSEVVILKVWRLDGR